MYSRIARELKGNYGLDIDVTTAVMRGFVDLVRKYMRSGESLRVPGLGVLRPTYRKAKTVKCNLPDPRLRGKEYRVPLRISAFLEPSPEFLREESYCPPPEVRRKWAENRERRRREEGLGDVVE